MKPCPKKTAILRKNYDPRLNYFVLKNITLLRYYDQTQPTLGVLTYVIPRFGLARTFVDIFIRKPN